jgi:hypothetical protein
MAVKMRDIGKQQGCAIACRMGGFGHLGVVRRYLRDDTGRIAPPHAEILPSGI